MTNKEYTSIITLPDGTCARVYAISSASPKGSSVEVRGDNGVIITTLEFDHDYQAKRVAELIMDCLRKGKKAIQPDWSFLTDVEHMIG